MKFESIESHSSDTRGAIPRHVPPDGQPDMPPDSLVFVLTFCDSGFINTRRKIYTGSNKAAAAARTRAQAGCNRPLAIQLCSLDPVKPEGLTWLEANRWDEFVCSAIGKDDRGNISCSVLYTPPAAVYAFRRRDERGNDPVETGRLHIAWVGAAR
jgi:hypothetical protein